MTTIADAIIPDVYEPRTAVAEPYSDYDRDPVMFWNAVGLRFNQLTHTIRGPHDGPTMSSRALGILHLAIHDACFAIPQNPTYPTYLNAAGGPGDAPALPPKPAGNLSTTDAIAGAAHEVLVKLYGGLTKGFPVQVARRFDREIGDAMDAFRKVVRMDAVLDPASVAYGRDIARAIVEWLAVKEGEIGAGDTLPGERQWEPQNGRFEFRDEPTHPVRLVHEDNEVLASPETKAVKVYHGPYYGATVRPFAVTRRHYIGDPPFERNAAETDEYDDAFKQVYAKGGAPGEKGTTRTPDQTVAGIFWAYDGANLIGTPPRLYNQILRKVAMGRFEGNGSDSAHLARLFGLANAAMADAGIMAWQEKYRYRYWRPLSGVREDDPSSGPGTHAGSNPISSRADPFWFTLGAPATNTHAAPFKPPFPAYPSGHATFGAAAFHIARCFFKDLDSLPFPLDGPDNISFTFVSEELNGESRNLDNAYVPQKPISDQPGNVNTRIVRSFESLWQAIKENAISRIYLGVHWIFDAYAEPKYAQMRPSTKPDFDDGPPPVGEFPIGGVPLGLGIADDIYGSGLKPSPVPKPAETGAPAVAVAAGGVLRSQTPIR